MFYFRSPKIYPIFPKSWGETSFVMDYQNEVMMKALDSKFNGNVSFTITYFSSGSIIYHKEIDVKFKDGKTDKKKEVCNISLDSLGYMEIGVIAKEPIFYAPQCGSGYALYENNNGNYITLNNDTKFSHYRVIEQMKTWSKYSLVHTSIICSKQNDLGNSFLLINPYKKPILAKLSGDTSKQIRKKILPLDACMIDLSDLVEREGSSNVFLTANNRLVAYDVKHKKNDLSKIYNIDHLDVYSGEKTWYEKFSDNLQAYKRSFFRKAIGRNF